MTQFTRRHFVVAAAAATLGACNTTGSGRAPAPALQYRADYGPILDEPFPIPAVNLNVVPPEFRRQVVRYRTEEVPGTVVVDTNTFHLYLVQQGGTALRYGVGLGRQGFSWSGDAVIDSKQEWPRWFPPKEMIAREPHLEKFSEKNGGQPPGLDNALGSRALYLYENGVDTLYRLHGTAQEASIGNAVSSGCVRLLNQDIIHLYDRVAVGAKVVVIPPRGGTA